VKKRLGLAVAALLLLALAATTLDLRGRGPLWQSLYSLTGEEGIVGQLYGFIGYLGNFTRRTPNPRPDLPVNYQVENRIGVNSFLELEAEPAKREKQLQLMAEASIGWIRQKFTWQDIEISGRGNFTDTRNDLDGDGKADPVDAWAKYDMIVRLAGQYNIQIIARLGAPPAWSQAEGLKGTFAPPENYADFVAYAAAVAGRYKGQISHYQVWNEPNLSHEWGGQPVDPVAYTDLLCQTYRALKAVDPNIKVISGAIAPTIDLSGYNLNGFIFLQRMYDAGAANCFDILGAQGYGLFSSPADQRLRITTINYAYPLWLRDMMVANDDAEKPIWVGEMAWNAVPSEAENANISDRLAYGQVTEAQSAAYAVEAYERAAREWPWMGVICYWFFKRADESEINQSWYYFRMVDPDFTLRPVYFALKDYATR
jgi:polysaccharide biosynthesis protein PslG